MKKLLTVCKFLPIIFFVVCVQSIFSMETPSREEEEPARALLLSKAIGEAYLSLHENIGQLIQVKMQIGIQLPLLEQIIKIERNLIDFQDLLSGLLSKGFQEISGTTISQENLIIFQLRDISLGFDRLRVDWEELMTFFPEKVALARASEELRREVKNLIQSEGFCPITTFFDIYLVGKKRWEAFKENWTDIYTNFGVPFLQIQEGPLGKYLRGNLGPEVMLKQFDTEEIAKEAIIQSPGILDVYKIHLMPKDEDLLIFIRFFLQIIKGDVLLQENISGIKVKPVTESFVEQLERELFQKEGSQLPKIVVYVKGGKGAAQAVLNRIYEHFKDWQGVYRVPRFNERVTSLIFFAQGNGEDKQKFPNLYTDDGVYFKSDVTGEGVDYTLRNPALVKKRSPEREIDVAAPSKKREKKGEL